jgi:hypothetical protein
VLAKGPRHATLALTAACSVIGCQPLAPSWERAINTKTPIPYVDYKTTKNPVVVLPIPTKAEPLKDYTVPEPPVLEDLTPLVPPTKPAPPAKPTPNSAAS